MIEKISSIYVRQFLFSCMYYIVLVRPPRWSSSRRHEMQFNSLTRDDTIVNFAFLKGSRKSCRWWSLADSEPRNETIRRERATRAIQRACLFSYKRRSRLRVLSPSRRQLWGLYARNKLPIENEGTARMQREECDSGHPLFARVCNSHEPRVRSSCARHVRSL